MKHADTSIRCNCRVHFPVPDQVNIGRRDISIESAGGDGECDYVGPRRMTKGLSARWKDLLLTGSIDGGEPQDAVHPKHPLILP